MKYLLFSLLFLFTLNCSLNKVSNSHGARFFDAQYDKILLNKSNKNDIRKLIGPPSSISKFNDTWFYIERIKTNQSLFKLGEKKLLDINDMNDIKIVEKITKKKFGNDNKLYDVLSSLREKINAPTKRKK